MAKQTKTASLEQIKCTNIVYAVRDLLDNDDETAKVVGVSKATFYTRLERNNWKTTEISHITLKLAIQYKINI